MSRTLLSANLNKVATLRNTRTIGIPSVARAAEIVLKAGAAGVTLHPRPDERHIRPHDLDDVAQVLRAFPEAEFNIEGNPFLGFFEHIERIRPTQATLVPDEPDVFTSDHGWDVVGRIEELREVVERLHTLGCRVSLFMDPEPELMTAAAETGTDRVELYTEPYAAAYANGTDVELWLDRYAAAARAALDAGLRINAGHDLNLENLGPFLERVPGVEEVSIGHALIADALEMGLEAAVKAYLAITERKEK